LEKTDAVLKEGKHGYGNGRERAESLPGKGGPLMAAYSTKKVSNPHESRAQGCARKD